MTFTVCAHVFICEACYGLLCVCSVCVCVFVCAFACVSKCTFLLCVCIHVVYIVVNST